MAKIKSPLLMADGARVRTMEELREHFDIASILTYYDSGKLHEWLENYYYDEEADGISKLDPSSADIKDKICGILGVSYSGDEAGNISLADVSDKNKRLDKLKKYTSEDEFLKAVDYVAFTQEELQVLLDGGAKKIYLCQEQGRFEIPEAEGITYIGVNYPSASVPEWFGGKGIVLQNVDIGIEELLLSAGEYSANHDYGEAVKLWSKAAAFDKVEAQRELGRCYYVGNGVAHDYKEAYKWYRKAAEQGDAEAQRMVGVCCYYGNGISRDYREAFKWYMKAAEQGDAEAQYELGNCYCNGQGVDQDYEEAEKWNKKAAMQGHERAMRVRPYQKEFEEYVNKCKEFLNVIHRMPKSWEAWNGELHTHEGRVQYAKFLNNLADNLDANSHWGHIIRDNMCNLNSFAQTMFSRHKELRITEIYLNGDPDYDTTLKVSSNISVIWNDDENASRTLKEYFEENICGMMSPERRKCFSVNWMETNPSNEDINWAFQIFSVGVSLNLGTYECIFKRFFDSLLKKLNRHDEMLDEVTALSKQYPIVYDKDLKTTFIWEYEAKEPYIEIEIPYPNLKEEYRNKKCKHYADVYLEEYETTSVLMHFCNMPMSNYTVRYHIEKNEYVSWDDFKTYTYVDKVEWGNWVSKDVCELQITKNNKVFDGELTVKITVDEVESAVAIIKSSIMP